MAVNSTNTRTGGKSRRHIGIERFVDFHRTVDMNATRTGCRAFQGQSVRRGLGVTGIAGYWNGQPGQPQMGGVHSTGSRGAGIMTAGTAGTATLPAWSH